MEAATVILLLQGVFWTTCVILIIYLIFRRIRIKKSENFEDRDN